MIVTVTPATILDLAAHGGSRSRVQWGVARALYDAGQFHVLHAGDELVAFAGFVPLEEGVTECVFNALPAARRHLPATIAAMRLTIEAAPYRAMVTVCGSAAGKIIARRLGFTFQAECELGEVWRYGSSDRRDGEQNAQDAEGLDRGGAASDAR